jgi:anti-sigma regulatory factor (Ser/Thr protein kinase)
MAANESLTASYPAVAEYVPLARKAVAAFARLAGASDQQVESICLATSEALTNAVRHAYDAAEPGQFHLTAAVTADELWVLVADDGRGLRARGARAGLGVGLAVIACMTDYFAIMKRSSGGTEVRMRFRLSPAQTGSRHALGSVDSASLPA